VGETVRRRKVAKEAAKKQEGDQTGRLEEMPHEGDGVVEVEFVLLRRQKSMRHDGKRGRRRKGKQGEGRHHTSSSERREGGRERERRVVQSRRAQSDREN
jgi:hypothetical protein